MSKHILSRRALLRAGLATAATVPLAGCSAYDFLQDRDNAMRAFMISMNRLTYRAQRLLQSPGQLAQEFTEADIRQDQHPNGVTDPDTPDYLTLKDGNFSAYRLQVDGLVERPTAFSLSDLKAMPSRTQITRHDCVEGWSAIAKWKGARLWPLLQQAGIKPTARYVAFFCADTLELTLDGTGDYYETIDLADARHAQTLLAYEMNDQPLPVAHGAPIRLRLERQLGYKMAKYVMRIEAIDSFAKLGRGRGGYWEDRGYQWYAGI